jgi:carboxymethylenebutenolidase
MTAQAQAPGRSGALPIPEPAPASRAQRADPVRAGAARAPRWAQPLCDDLGRRILPMSEHGHDTTLQPIDGHATSAWVERPAAPPRGGVVVVQEIFGVNPHIRAVAARFAQAGFLAVAPRLFDRVAPGTELGYDEAGIARGRELVAALGFDAALRDVHAAAGWLRAQGLKAGVVGFCWGGTAALLSATRLGLPAVSYYGGRSMAFLHEHPQAPLLLHYGARDPLIPPEHVAAQRAAFPEAEVHVHAAGHGFNCDQRTDFDSAASAAAWRLTLDFLHRHLAASS